MTRVTAMVRRGCHGAVVALIGMGCLSPAQAQAPGSRQTRDFVATVAQADAFEILEAQTALAESAAPEVRAFATKMIADHAALDRALAEAAAKAGLQPPGKGVGADQAPLLNSLQSLTGPAFDRAYLLHQRLAHQATLVEAQTYATSGDDPSIRTLAAAAAQTIAAHRAMAEQMSGQVPLP
jgi:putative membrane protein